MAIFLIRYLRTLSTAIGVRYSFNQRNSFDGGRTKEARVALSVTQTYPDNEINS